MKTVRAPAGHSSVSHRCLATQRAVCWRKALLLAGYLLLAGSVVAQERASDSADLPVSSVVLFTSGVGYFEHSGTVTGNAQLEISVPGAAMDDLLQSLVLQDFGGGTIQPVRYPARDPLARIPGSYSLDLSGDPTLAQLLSQARGQLVEIEASVPLAGRVVNVERVSVAEEEPVTYLTLATGFGLRRIDLAEVSSISFSDEALQQELTAALEAIARYQGEDDQTVRLRFEGDGERPVNVGYVREMPVWKSSYRLLLREDGAADLQGWAIFDNPTDMDLEEVTVSFVAGQPISFVSTLFEPVYLQRQRVGAMQSQSANARQFAADSFEESRRERVAMEAPAAPTLAAPAPAPQLSGAGVEAMASGATTGATFEYRVAEPVSVGRHESAMIPIISATVSAHRLSIFDPGSHPLHPLRGVRLQNDIGLHLAAGPVTVFDEGGFTGNALLGDVVPGDSRVLAYALDLDLAVSSSSASEPEEVVAVAIRNGIVETSHRQRITTEFEIEMRSEGSRFLVIEQPGREGYEVVSPTTPPATTPEGYRFGVEIRGEDSSTQGDPTVPTHLRCRPDTSCELTIVLERELSRTVALGNLSSQQIAFYLENVTLSDEDRRTFDEILELKRQLADLDSRLAAEQQQLDAIFRDQGRIRQNMAQLDRNSSLYRRYLADLEAQEEELDTLGGTVEDLNRQRRTVQEQLDTLISALQE